MGSSAIKIIGVAWLLAAAAAGCGAKAGVIFPPHDPPIVWPPPPETTRIVYVGQLATSADLKPARSGFEGLGQLLFGKKESYSMLAPFAVTTDGADRVFVADTGAQIVHVFDLRTRRYARWVPDPGRRPRNSEPSRFSQPVALAWDPSGRLLVADSVAGVIYVFDDRGALAGVIGQGVLQRPAGIVVEPGTGRIFVADVLAHQVLVLSAAGELTARIGGGAVALGEFNYPTNLALDRQGRLYVSDSLNFRVQQFSPELRPLRQIGRQGDVPGTFAQPKGIAVDAEGHLYVVDSRFENIQIFDDQGRLLLAFGSEGTGPGQFWLPAGVSIDGRGRIWVANPYNRRIEVFDYVSAGDAVPATAPVSPVMDDPWTSPTPAVRPFEAATRPGGSPTRPSQEVRP